MRLRGCFCAYTEGPSTTKLTTNFRVSMRQIEMKIALFVLHDCHVYQTHCQVEPKKIYEQTTARDVDFFFFFFHFKLLCRPFDGAACASALRHRLYRISSFFHFFVRNRRRYRRHCHLIFCCSHYVSHYIPIGNKSSEAREMLSMCVASSLRR